MTEGPTGPAWLAGGGEMGARMRAKDWSRSPLGPPDTWPQSIKTAVSVCLNSRFPILLWLGPELRLVYNDPYIPFLGERKHPSALGKPGGEVWKEVWPAIGPMHDEVAAGRSTSVEDLRLFFKRHLPREEVYVTFSYSPIFSTDGHTIDGVFCACIETTEKVVGARRLTTLRDLGSRSAERRTVETACRDAAEVLGRNPLDVPFAAIYLLDKEGKSARLAAGTRLDDDPAAFPLVHPVGSSAGGPWPLNGVAESGTTCEMSDLEATVGVFPASPRPDEVETAFVLPLRVPSQPHPAGFLIAGVSPHRVLDSGYRSFLELAAGHITASIADARAFEAERRRAEALAEIDRAKTAFFSNISHEFSTPLTLMMSPIEELLAERAGTLASDQRGLLEVAHRNSLRLLRLVNSLLDFSRVEAGRIQASYEPVDLAALTADLASNFRSACERAGLELKIDCPPLPQPVYVDQEMWEKIVLNLVSNAFKFTLEGRIEVSIRADGADAVVLVKDSGAGIPEEDLARIFERFHRVAGQRGRTHEGTGIGLALVKELVQLHCGQIRVESKVGQGTTFTVRVPFGRDHLPADRIQASPALASTAIRADAFVEEALRWLPSSEAPDISEALIRDLGPQPHDVPDHGQRAHVLVAEDNADMREHLGRLLSKLWDVEAVADGAAALEAARQKPPDLVLADVMMPRLDGLGLLSALRADPALAEIPIILLSARAGEEARIEGLRGGADDYLTKPFSARELVARVRSQLALSRLRAEATEQARDNLAALATLHEVSTRSLQSSELQPILEMTLDAAMSLANAPLGNIQLLNKKGALAIVTHRGFKQSFLDFFREMHSGKGSTCGAALERGGTVIVEDVDASDLFKEMPSRPVMLEAGAMAVISVPLVARTGRLVGMLNVHFSAPHRPGSKVLQRLEVLGRQVADFIERTTLLQHLRQSEAWLAGQKEAFQAAVNGAPLAETLGILLRTAIEQTDSTARGAFHSANDQRTELRHLVGMPESFARHVEGFKIDAGSLACGLAMATGEPVITPDVRLEPRWKPWLWLAEQYDFRGCWSFPVETSMKELVGTFAMYFREPRAPTQENLDLAASLTHTASIIISRYQEAEEHARAARALRESEARLQAAVDLVKLGLYTWNPQTDELQWDGTLRAMWALPEDTAVTEEVWLAGIHPDDRARVKAAVENARAPGSEGLYDIEYRVIGQTDGMERWIATRGRVNFENGAPASFQGVALDVTAAKRIEETLERRVEARTCELREANRELRYQIVQRERAEAEVRQLQRLDAIGQITSGVAHDFNNLLSVVLTNARLLSRHLSDPDDQESIDLIRIAAERGAKLIAQLLAFSRKQRLEPQEIDLNGKILDMKELLGVTLGGTVRLETALAEDLWPALVDPTQIELIVLNLAINARDAMEAGGILTIESFNAVIDGTPLHPEDLLPGDYVGLAVRDTGTGIADDVLPQVFEPFFTTKEPGKGSGLGLAQVYGFAKQSGGGVSIETHLGGGTAVKVFLPRAGIAPIDREESVEVDRDARARNKVTILVVDDERPVLRSAVRALDTLGYAAVAAPSGEDALRLLSNGHAADLVLADFAMPDMTGVDLAEAIGARYPGLPVILITGYGGRDILKNFGEARILQKPYDERELVEKIERALSQTRPIATH